MQANQQTNTTTMNTTAKSIITVLVVIIAALIWQVLTAYGIAASIQAEKNAEVTGYKQIIGSLFEELEKADLRFYEESLRPGFYALDFDYGDDYSLDSGYTPLLEEGVAD